MISSEDLKLKRAVQLLCSTGIRRPLASERMRTWLKQFSSGPEHTLALLILRHLIYRTSNQIESSLTQALRRMALHFALNDKDRSTMYWRDILEGRAQLNFYFGPPEHEYTRPGKSGELIIRLLKQIFSIKSEQIEYPSSNKTLSTNERFLMIDDGTFSGDQLSKIIEANSTLMKRPGQTGVVVSIAHERALQRFERDFPEIPVFYGEKMTEQDGLVAISEQWIVAGNWPYGNDLPCEVYNEIVKKAGFKTVQPLGYAGLGLMVAYEHGIPDDSLQLLWDKSDSWTPLFDR
ncbi:phosphoribosyltransferase-like protein [Undibacterium sp. TJN19]|uniref:phosphoribosyltransferase-like protein n=1 Tax=Undibacterium sp. TJN19 TaxID=3413055 RepID=UPI003BF1283A